MDWANLTDAERIEAGQAAVDRMRPPRERSEDEVGDIACATLSYCGSMDGVLGQVVGWGYEAALHEPWDRTALGKPKPLPRSLRQDIQRDVIDHLTRSGCLNLVGPGITDLVRSAQFQGPVTAYASDEEAAAIEGRLGIVAEGLVNDLYDTYYHRDVTQDEWEQAWQGFWLGVALALYGVWREQLTLRGVPEDLWMPDLDDGDAVPDDHLAGVAVPSLVGECQLYPWVAGWMLTSEQGFTKASHSTKFVSFLRVAYVSEVLKNHRLLTVPIRSHADALATLGFHRAVLPGGRELDLSPS